MNYWLIAGIILSVLGGISTGIGVFIQQKRDTIKNQKIEHFQKLTTTQLENIEEVSTDTLITSKRVESNIGSLNIPEIVLTGVRVDWNKKLYGFQIENSGNATADAVDLLLDYPFPGGHGNLHRIRQVVKGGKTVITCDIFPLYDMFHNSDGEGKKEYDECVSSFLSGKRALIVHIKLTYHWGSKNSETVKYTLLHSRDRMSLDKEDKRDFPYPKTDE